MNFTLKDLLLALMGFIFLALPVVVPIDHIVSHNIEYFESPELGSAIIVTFHDAIDPDTAKKNFRITPYMAGSFEWIGDKNKLIFLPYEPLDPQIRYVAYMDMPYSLTASIFSKRKELIHEEKPVSEARAMIVENVNDIPYKKGKFIDVNLMTMTVTTYQDGKKIQNFMIAGKGNPKSARTREGNFKILSKEENHLSNLSNVWMPWSLRYSGGYYLHEWARWPSGARVESRYSNGCVRLFEGDAKKIFDFADAGTPVRIHTTMVENTVEPSTLTSRNLVRESTNDRTYIVNIANGDGYKRKASKKFEKYYGYYEPFEGVTKIVPLGALSDFTTLNIVKLENTNGGPEESLYVLTDEVIKQKVPCNNEPTCRELLGLAGIDYDAVFPASKTELDTYIIGEPVTQEYLRKLMSATPLILPVR